MMYMLSNPLLNIAFLSWLSAQIIKSFLHWGASGSFKLERLTGSGGMPSSHSAFVVSLTIAMARVEGFSSPIFALTVAFAAVVMYDAMGVRRAAGEQAKTLNNLIGNYQDLWEFLMHNPILQFDDDDDADSDDNDETDDKQETAGEGGKKRKALKEYLGHTPLEVSAGALLGILIAMIYPL